MNVIASDWLVSIGVIHDQKIMQIRLLEGFDLVIGLYGGKVLCGYEQDYLILSNWI